MEYSGKSRDWALVWHSNGGLHVICRWSCRLLVYQGKRVYRGILDTFCVTRVWGNIFEMELKVGCLYQENLEFEITRGSRIRVRAGGLSMNPTPHNSWGCMLSETFIFEPFTLRSGNTGNIFVQLVSQHCCIVSWNPLLCVLPRLWPTCLTAKIQCSSLHNSTRIIGQLCGKDTHT